MHEHIDRHNRPEDFFKNSQPLKHARNALHQFSHVNSSQHQAIDRLGSSLGIHAWCTGDIIIEQVQLVGSRFVTGVQYHPERSLIYVQLFSSFYDAVWSKS